MLVRAFLSKKLRVVKVLRVIERKLFEIAKKYISARLEYVDSITNY